MAKIIHIQKAQQRYKMMPVIDEDTGEQKVVETTRNKRGGGKVMRSLTVADKTQPEPMPTCDYGGCEDREIKVGMPYKILPVKQQYGGRSLIRHEHHPDWQPWEHSSALWARVAQCQAQTFDVDGVSTAEDAESIGEELAAMITELAEEKRESADNIEENFPGSEQASELSQAADELEEWADNVTQAVSNAGIDDPPEATEECEACEGTGTVGEGDDNKDCEQCGINADAGQVENQEYETQLADWQEQVRDAYQSALDDAPAVG